MKLAPVLVVALLGGTAHADADDQADLDAQFAQLSARPKPRYLRPAIEEALAVGAGAAWYWIDRERQVADWDFPSWQERFNGDAWRFDRNPFPINWAWHAIDGGQYHLFARTSDLSMLVSAGYGLATSFVWEWGLEFREKMSVNDFIVTTGAGTAVGEFFHWLGRYFESAPAPRRWHGAARWGLTTTRALHNVLDDRVGLRPGTAPDALGFSSDIWHRFVVGAGGTTSGWGALTARGELAALPGYRQPRRMQRTFKDGNVSSADVKVTLGDEALGFEFGADVMLLGFHRQTARSSTTIGVDLAYRYRKEKLEGWEGRVAQMHLPGLGVDQHVGPVRMKARAHVDFAGLDAAAYPEWAVLHPGLFDGKTILRNHKYYYAWGVYGSLAAEVDLPRATIGASIEYGRYASHEGLDRAQEDLVEDVPAGDHLLRWDAWARVAPLGGRGFVEARVLEDRDDGYLGEVESRRSLRRITLSVGAVL